MTNQKALPLHHHFAGKINVRKMKKKIEILPWRYSKA